MPPNTISVCRPGRFGNPYRVGVMTPLGRGQMARELSAADAVNMYREYVMAPTEASRRFRIDIKNALRGKNLACWCPTTEPCHADILLEIANTD